MMSEELIYHWFMNANHLYGPVHLCWVKGEKGYREVGNDNVREREDRKTIVRQEEAELDRQIQLRRCH